MEFWLHKRGRRVRVWGRIRREKMSREVRSRQRCSADTKWKEGMERDGVSRWTRALYRWCLMTVTKKNLKQEFLKLES